MSKPAQTVAGEEKVGHPNHVGFVVQPLGTHSYTAGPTAHKAFGKKETGFFYTTTKTPVFNGSTETYTVVVV